MVTAELALDCRNVHGEGVLWDSSTKRLWWTDIQGEKLWWFEPESGQSAALDMPGRVCCFALRARGGLLLALADEIAFYDSESNTLETIHRFEPHNSHTRLNDGRTDRQGRFIAGGMNEVTGEADSSVIRVEVDGSVTTLIEGVACANSTCFAPDGLTMYFADSPQKAIRAYDYDAKGGPLGSQHTLIDMREEPGIPDGSCVDAEGYVWNAAWEGYRVVRIAPDGRIDRVVDVPVEKPTCCTFGGADLDTLFITSSRLGSSEDRLVAEPQSGGLFAIKPGVRGLAETPFAG